MCISRKDGTDLNLYYFYMECPELNQKLEDTQNNQPTIWYIIKRQSWHQNQTGISDSDFGPRCSQTDSLNN